MGWYGWLSLICDPTPAGLCRSRCRAAAVLQLKPAAAILGLPDSVGQSLALLTEGPQGGHHVGVALSPGMLASSRIHGGELWMASANRPG
ncbi:MAG TPA: hypothetical protein ENK18_20450 [Deltaproteobacteria bacterium]|nr:hypothetical protein [Deltaproteobacteria bacterium]